MRRPGPLQELPLEHFLPPNPNLPKSPSKLARGSKRPISPGAPSTFSPAKRRILNEEGIFWTRKSPVSASARSPARFGDVVQGPDSPARKLDFGLPKNHSQSTAGSSTLVNSAASSQCEDVVLDTTPKRNPVSTKRLAPSPELLPKSVSAPIASSSSYSFDSTLELDDYFSPHLPTMIPRELPALPDRQSVHYPGFDVCSDTHIPLLRARSASVSSVEPLAELKRDKEACKENLAPRRKAKKAATAPDSSELTKAGLLSTVARQMEIERVGKSQSTPVTPSKLSLRERESTITPTPQRYGPAFMRDLATPYRMTPASNQKERKERRKMLEDEVDDAGVEEDACDDIL
ncbi:hypothetical protein PILCRDRAFT_811644 [Piloderma croceum F 1598]|uniref:Uncharacterized protein n=1 Tax=Piloderma croceum (strain F 1598) TaxID=765440 RepID=A0A0C3GKL6_PILCF|nr:hypothetical protein PILCRDRAFT_811644 [Piloderma croceum F 1598]